MTFKTLRHKKRTRTILKSVKSRPRSLFIYIYLFICSGLVLEIVRPLHKNIDELHLFYGITKL